MQHPTRSTTIRIDDNAPRSCIYDDRRDGYCAGDREARYPHLFRGNAVFLPSNKRWTGSDLGSVSQLKYLYSLEDRVHCKRNKCCSCPRDSSCHDARLCTRCRYPAMYSVTRSVDIHTHTHLTLPSTFVIPTCYAHPSFQSLRRMEQDIRRRRANPLVIVLLSKPRTDVLPPPVPQHLQTITSKLPNFQPRSTTSPVRRVPFPVIQ